jgi:hypothetical protein
VIAGYEVYALAAKQQRLQIDQSKLNYCTAVLLWLYFTELWLHESKQAECLLSIKYCVKIAVQVPDHMMALRLFELQGKICQYFDNQTGALKAFQRMRDVAEDMQSSED